MLSLQAAFSQQFRTHNTGTGTCNKLPTLTGCCLAV